MAQSHHSRNSVSYLIWTLTHLGACRYHLAPQQVCPCIIIVTGDTIPCIVFLSIITVVIVMIPYITWCQSAQVHMTSNVSMCQAQCFVCPQVSCHTCCQGLAGRATSPHAKPRIEIYDFASARCASPWTRARKCQKPEQHACVVVTSATGLHFLRLRCCKQASLVP